MRELLVQLDDVIDGLLDEVVRPVGAAALGRHHAGLAVEALQGVVVERLLALGNARTPGTLVAHLGSTRDSGSMTSRAGGFVGGSAVCR